MFLILFAQYGFGFQKLEGDWTTLSGRALVIPSWAYSHAINRYPQPLPLPPRQRSRLDRITEAAIKALGPGCRNPLPLASRNVSPVEITLTAVAFGCYRRLGRRMDLRSVMATTRREEERCWIDNRGCRTVIERTPPTDPRLRRSFEWVQLEGLRERVFLWRRRVPGRRVP